MRLLVTGFGPFPTMPRNPSAGLARAVAMSRRLALHGVRTDLRVLTTAYAALAHEFDPALARAPDAVLMIGVAGRSPRIRVERRATARRSTLFPDVAGETARQPAPAAARHTRVPTIAALRLLRQAGVPSRISRDAGRYLCNAAYFQALGRPCPVLFIHIPKPGTSRAIPARRPQRIGASERLRRGLVEIALLALRVARVDAGRRRALQRS